MNFLIFVSYDKKNFEGSIKQFIQDIIKEAQKSDLHRYNQELQEILLCYIQEIREICGSCEIFSECKKLQKIRERFDVAYFLKKEQRTTISRLCGKFFYLILETIFIFM